MAFTLIELLVVIAIIAVLMGILMPALGRVREQARTIRCRSNLKQYAIGMRMYLDDNDYRFPNTNNWMSSLQGSAWLKEGETPNGQFWPYVKDKGCHMCPRFRQLIKNDAKYGDTMVSYLLNSYIGNNGRIWNSWLGPNVKGVTKENQVYRPSEVITFTEENTFTIPGYSNYPYNDMLFTCGNAQRQIDNFATFHDAPASDLSKGGANMAFVDGHVDFLRRRGTGDPDEDREELEKRFRLTWPKKNLPY